VRLPRGISLHEWMDRNSRTGLFMNRVLSPGFGAVSRVRKVVDVCIGEKELNFVGRFESRPLEQVAMLSQFQDAIASNQS
jgi:hypothetical protein